MLKVALLRSDELRRGIRVAKLGYSLSQQLMLGDRDSNPDSRLQRPLSYR